MPSAPHKSITEEEYLALDRQAPTKSEYAAAEMFLMAGGTSNHSRLQGDLYTELNLRLSGGPCEAFGSDMRVKVEPARMYAYPDISVVCGTPLFLDAIEDTLLNPVVIVEVLSPSTEAYDRGKKCQNYQSIRSLQEFVLVSQEQVRVERFLRAQSGTWTLHTYAGIDQQLSLDSIGVSIPLSAIYRRVSAAIAQQ